MPIYEFVCKTCKCEFEELARTMTETPRIRCPECGAAGVDRRLSVFATHEGSAKTAPLGGGGCGRCGDLQGPCGL